LLDDDHVVRSRRFHRHGAEVTYRSCLWLAQADLEGDRSASDTP
jgi:hypothetical protein